MTTNRRITALLFTLAVASTFAAQISLAQEAADIEGMVTLSGSTEPVVSAVVSFISAAGGERRATTGADGKFTVRAIPPGSYKINLAKPGFFTPPDGFGAAAITLDAGQRLNGVTLHLLKGGVIAGRFADQYRNPRSNVRVDAMRYRYVNGQRTLALVATTPTDDRGEYRFFGLEPGDYVIAVVGMLDRSESIPPTYYPGVGDARTAVVIPLKAGMEAGGINFSPSSDNSYSVTVRVRTPADFSSQRYVGVSLISSNPASLPISMSAQPDARNIYVFEKVPRGSYVVNVQVREGLDRSEASRPLYARTTVVVADENVDAGTLVLQPGFEVAGRIVRSNQVPIDLDLRRLRVSLFAVEGPLRISPMPVSVNPDGTFQTPNLPEGVYRVSLTGLPETLFLESISYAARTTGDLTFSLEGPPVGSVDLRLDGPAGVVHGTVRNAANDVVSAAQVFLIPPAERRTNPDLFRSATTDQNGLFTIRGVAPGDYQVLAWQKVEAGALLDPEYVRRSETQAVKITVERNSNSDVNLRVISNSP